MRDKQVVSDLEIQKIAEYIEKQISFVQSLPKKNTNSKDDSVEIIDIIHLGISVSAMKTYESYPDFLPSVLALADNKSRPKTSDFYHWLNTKPEAAIDFTELTIHMLDKKGYKNNYPEFYRKAEIDRRLFSKIVSEAYEYHPDIKTVFKLIVGLELGIDEATKLLNSAAYDFGTVPFNLVIRYCIENQIFNHDQIDKYLLAICNQTLYSLA